MPITIKSTGMKYKNPDTGVYQGVDMLEEATIRDVIVDVYSPTSSYSVGKHCLYNGELYCCTTAIPEGGEAWNLAHWEKTKVTDELEDIKGAINDLGSDDIDNDSTVTGTTVSDALETLGTTISGLDSDDIANASTNVSGSKVTDAIDNLNGAITHKLDYLDLGAIPGSSNKAAIEAAFNAVTVYDKPVSIKFSNSGFWSGIVYKYSAVNYGTIYATYPVDRISYFGYMVNGTFSVYLNATEADISALQTSLNAIIPLDTVPTNGSTKGITSDAVYDAITNLTTVNNVTTELALTSPYTIRLQEAKKVGKIVNLRCAINNNGNAFNIQSGFSARVNPLCQITKYKPAIQINCMAYFSNSINAITDGFCAAIIQTNGNILCDMVTSTIKEITMEITYITDE